MLGKKKMKTPPTMQTMDLKKVERLLKSTCVFSTVTDKWFLEPRIHMKVGTGPLKENR